MTQKAKQPKPPTTQPKVVEPIESDRSPNSLGPRVLIIGCSGSGKSTLARKLSVLVGLPTLHLDRLFWKPGWKMSDRDVFNQKLNHELLKESWIMDGNFDSSLPQRIARATDVLAFDLPRWICLYRVAMRIIKGYGRARDDMADGCPEKIDFAFLKWIWRFNIDVWPPTLKILEENKNRVQITYFKKPKDVKRFLQQLP